MYLSFKNLSGGLISQRNSAVIEVEGEINQYSLSNGFMMGEKGSIGSLCPPKAFAELSAVSDWANLDTQPRCADYILGAARLLFIGTEKKDDTAAGCGRVLKISYSGGSITPHAVSNGGAWTKRRIDSIFPYKDASDTYALYLSIDESNNIDVGRYVLSTDTYDDDWYSTTYGGSVALAGNRNEYLSIIQSVNKGIYINCGYKIVCFYAGTSTVKEIFVPDNGWSVRSQIDFGGYYVWLARREAGNASEARVYFWDGISNVSDVQYITIYNIKNPVLVTDGINIYIIGGDDETPTFGKVLMYQNGTFVNIFEHTYLQSGIYPQSWTIWRGKITFISAYSDSGSYYIMYIDGNKVHILQKITSAELPLFLKNLQLGKLYYPYKLSTTRKIYEQSSNWVSSLFTSGIITFPQKVRIPKVKVYFEGTAATNNVFELIIYNPMTGTDGREIDVQISPSMLDTDNNSYSIVKALEKVDKICLKGIWDIQTPSGNPPVINEIRIEYEILDLI